MKKPTITLLFAVLAIGEAIALVLLYQANTSLQKENQALRQQEAELKDQVRLLANKERQAEGSSALNSQDFQELLRLRGEVGLLKRQLAESSKLRADNDRLRQRLPQETGATAELNPEVEEQKQKSIAKMSYLKNWILAFHLYATKNNGQFPTGFPQAVPYFSADPKVEEGHLPDQYEIVFQGSLADLTNPPPASAIVIREKQAWQTLDGKLAKTYGFADGHTEIHVEPTGSFEAWESQRLPRAR